MVVDLDDRKIIELFYERSEQAIMELSNKYGSVCTKVAYNILNNKQDTEECINDAYLGAWNTIPPQNPNPLVSYVCRIVRNLAIKKYHSNTAAKRNSIYDVALDELENCFPSAGSVEAELDAKELARYIDSFLETLSHENRIMFVVTFILLGLMQQEKSLSMQSSIPRKEQQKYMSKRCQEH